MAKHNFNAGPCVLPKEAIESLIAAARDFDGTGIGLFEISHRTKGWERVMKETVELWRELLNIPEDYAVLFLGGGASTHFYQVPANFLKTKAAYLQTGVWAKKAAKEAKLFGETVIVASSEDKNYTYVPKGYTIPTDADYFHITTNNTIYGTEIHEDIMSPVPLIADMSSDIMSRPVDVKKYAMIYGGAQKNVGPAGVTFAIIRKDMFGRSGRTLPAMENYATHWSDEEKNRSMYNTPPGVAAMLKRNQKKAATLYAEIERNKMFVGTAEKEDRSIMNVCFVMAKGYEDKQDAFLDYATKQGMVGLKGHRSVGGFRASIYNACSQEDVEALVACMRSFEKENA